MLIRPGSQEDARNVNAILRLIEKSKTVLFGPSNDSPAAKVKKWKEIHETSTTLGLISIKKNWMYLRDRLWPELKEQTMAKIIDVKGKKVKILGDVTKSDNIILDILGFQIDRQLFKLEVKSEPEDEEFEVISDEDINFETINGPRHTLKPPNITFIPVSQTNEKTLSNEHETSKTAAPASVDKVSASTNANTPVPIDSQSSKIQSSLDAKRLKVQDNDKEHRSSDQSNMFFIEIRSIHKQILENVRDIRMKQIMHKPTHCESCCNSNKEVLTVQKEILEVQKQNLDIQMQILEELKRKNNTTTNTTDQIKKIESEEKVAIKSELEIEKTSRRASTSSSNGSHCEDGSLNGNKRKRT